MSCQACGYFDVLTKLDYIYHVSDLALFVEIELYVSPSRERINGESMYQLSLIDKDLEQCGISQKALFSSLLFEHANDGKTLIIHRDNLSHGWLVSGSQAKYYLH